MSDTFLISTRDLLEVRQRDCWSIECMEGHGVEGREPEYIGSRIEENGKVWDYYVDHTGNYWYGTRWRESSGRIVTMEEHLFPGKNKRKRHRQ